MFLRALFYILIALLFFWIANSMSEFIWINDIIVKHHCKRNKRTDRISMKVDYKKYARYNLSFNLFFLLERLQNEE